MSSQVYLSFNKKNMVLKSFSLSKPKSSGSLIKKIKIDDWAKNSIKSEPIYLKIKVLNSDIISECFMSEDEVCDDEMHCISSQCKGKHLKSRRYPDQVLLSNSCNETHDLYEESQEYLLKLS